MIANNQENSMSEFGPSEEHQYHRAVEEVMETSGPNVGRIKDIEVAHEVAGVERVNRDRRYPTTEEAMLEYTDRETQAQVASRGAEIEGSRAAKMIGYSELGQPAPFEDDPDEGTMRDEAKEARRSYLQMQKDIPAHLRAANAQLQAELDAERAKNNGVDVEPPG